MMAGRPEPTEFVYHNIELYKSESLGSGSYGGVCKAKCDGLLCAAKIMHPTLFDLHDPGTASYISKFQEECHLLSLARHPNIVQYLGTSTDPVTQLPVLLMELCEESLTAFLERSPGPLSYHIQVDICHDIALALVYLHSNGLIHRDLTGNNVLMVAGPRAKITDFGMSKLANVNPHMTAFTVCPGNILYMSPEALDEAKSYTAKLDVFSFGVILIQILTRQFPNPTDRFHLVSVPNFTRPLRQEVPEVERRATHLNLIPESHSLKPLVLQCLRIEESQRPSALELSERLSELKQSSQYRESKCRARCNQWTQQHQERISELEMAVGERDRQLQENYWEYQASMQTKQRQLQEIESEMHAMQREHQTAIQSKVREHQIDLQRAISSRDQALERQKRELEASEQLVSEFLQSIHQKDKLIADLQQTISAHERKIQQPKQQHKARRDTPHQKTIRTPQTTAAAAGGGRDISTMKWRKGKNAPVPMLRGAAVAHGTTAYFRPSGHSSGIAYLYRNSDGEEQWSHLLIPNRDCGLVVIDGLLTIVGGKSDNGYTNILLSFNAHQWSDIFPPMPTPRSHVVCVTAGESLVVAGGECGNYLTTVEVMSTNTKQWSTVSALPENCRYALAVVCGHKLYLTGGYGLPMSTITCSLPDLLAPITHASNYHNVWREISQLPVKDSTLVSFGGDLLAIGGKDDSYKPTSTVYKYDSHTDSWTVVSHMKNKRSCCFAVTVPFPENQLIVVGGITNRLFGDDTTTNTIEVGF